MKINLRINLEDGTSLEVNATARDLVAFEQKFEKSIATLEKDGRLSDSLWIAWHYLNRTGAVKDDFESWCDNVETIEPGDESPK